MLGSLLIWFQMAIKTDDVDLAGDVIQALGAFLNLEDLSVMADLPLDMEELASVLMKVHSYKDCSGTMNRLVAN